MDEQRIEDQIEYIAKTLRKGLTQFIGRPASQNNKETIRSAIQSSLSKVAEYLGFGPDSLECVVDSFDKGLCNYHININDPRLIIYLYEREQQGMEPIFGMRGVPRWRYEEALIEVLNG